jgi:phosphoenolpyruvate carboxylase
MVRGADGLNMAATFINCTNELQSLIRLRWSEDVKTAETYRSVAQYVSNRMSQGSSRASGTRHRSADDS